MDDLSERKITGAVVRYDVHEHGSIPIPECMVLATATTILARHENFSFLAVTHTWYATHVVMFQEHAMTTSRIEMNAKVMMGKLVIRGTRIPVELILRKLSEGATEADLLDAHPRLTKADIQTAKML